MCYNVSARAMYSIAYHETSFSGVSRLEALRKAICNVYTYFEGQLSEIVITISSLLCHSCA